MLTASALYSALGQAGTWQQAWSARASAEYDTNPAMLSANTVGIRRYLFEPSYKLRRTEGVSEFGAGLALHMARSSDETLSQNRDDPSASLDWQRRSETGAFGLSAKYDEIATRITKNDNTGPGLADSTRASSTLAANWSEGLSERSTLSVDGAYSDVSYKGGTFLDYVTRYAGMKFRYAWSERSAPFLKISYTDYESEDGSPLRRLTNATLGWDWKVSDYLDGSVQAGQSQSKSSGVRKGTQGLVTVQYAGQQTWLVLSAGRQTSPSGLGGFVTADQVDGSWSYALSERSKTGFDLGWRKNYFSTDEITNHSAGAWLQHDLNSSWATRMYFLYKTSEGSTVERATAKIAGLSLVYTHSDF